MAATAGVMTSAHVLTMFRFISSGSTENKGTTERDTRHEFRYGSYILFILVKILALIPEYLVLAAWCNVN